MKLRIKICCINSIEEAKMTADLSLKTSDRPSGRFSRSVLMSAVVSGSIVILDRQMLVGFIGNVLECDI